MGAMCWTDVEQYDAVAHNDTETAISVNSSLLLNRCLLFVLDLKPQWYFWKVLPGIDSSQFFSFQTKNTWASMDNLKILVLFKLSCVCISVPDFLFAVCSSYESHERFFFVQIKKYVKKWLPTHETKYNKKKTKQSSSHETKGAQKTF